MNQDTLLNFDNYYMNQDTLLKVDKYYMNQDTLPNVDNYHMDQDTSPKVDNYHMDQDTSPNVGNYHMDQDTSPNVDNYHMTRSRFLRRRAKIQATLIPAQILVDGDESADFYQIYLGEKFTLNVTCIFPIHQISRNDRTGTWEFYVVTFTPETSIWSHLDVDENVWYQE